MFIIFWVDATDFPTSLTEMEKERRDSIDDAFRYAEMHAVLSVVSASPL